MIDKTNRVVLHHSPALVVNVIGVELGRHAVLADVDWLALVIGSSVNTARVVRYPILHDPRVSCGRVPSVTT